jgi:GNAT superfamily N-acetyltransferase
VVRDATADDAQGIATVHVRAWQAAYQGFVSAQLLDDLSVAHREDFWRAALSGADGALAFALVEEAEDGGIAGFCAVSLPARDDDAGERTAEIAATYVDPAHWHSGIGRALVEAAVAKFEPGAWDAATLWVFKRNAQARAFYARFGFRLDGATGVHTGTGAARVRMRAALHAPQSPGS